MTSYRQFVGRALTVIALIAIVGLVILFVRQVTNLVVLVFTAWVLAVTLEVPVRLLQRLKLPRIAAVLISVVLLLLIGGAIVALVVPPFIKQADALLSGLPDAIRRAARNYSDLRAASSLAARLLPPVNVSDVNSLLQGDLTLFLPLFEGVQQAPVDLQNLAGQALPVLREIGSFIVSAFANLLLLVLLVLLLLMEPTVYYRAIVSLVPRRREERTVEILNMIRSNVTNWLGAMLLSTGMTTILFLIVLGVIVGLPNAFALSLLAGLATFVPTFGPAIALIPIAVVAAAAGINKFVLTVILYAAVGLVQDRFVTPAVMKSELDIPAAALVVFQLALATVIGPLGLLLAVPILAILVTLVRELYVFDGLDKRGLVPHIKTRRDGQLVVQDEPPEPAEPEAGQSQ
jgi:predicted PurR-regulated permease PerM